MSRQLPDLVPVLRPQEVIHHHALQTDAGVAAATCSRRTRAASAADLTTPPARPGSEAGHRPPSRRGDRLYWPGGRVTNLDGGGV